MANHEMVQVSTLGALILGYFKKVVTVDTLLSGGDVGLGTFENVDGEMIVLDGHCYRALADGTVVEAKGEDGVPFASVTHLAGDRTFTLCETPGIEALKTTLNNKIEEGFGLNSMHVARIDGHFAVVRARSEVPFASQHVELREILSKTQKDFTFRDVAGTLVCVYYPDYMDGINAPGWHFHFLSEDRTLGGHVFDLAFSGATVTLDKVSTVRIVLPTEPAFDTYSLKTAKQNDVKAVEQSDK